MLLEKPRRGDIVVANHAQHEFKSWKDDIITLYINNVTPSEFKNRT